VRRKDRSSSTRAGPRRKALSALGLVLAAGAVVGMSMTTLQVASALTGPDPVAVRAAAKAAGLDSLSHALLPPADLSGYLKTGPAATLASQQLGKALFWDMQVGSDGQACASCHFNAGADTRSKNALNPGNLVGNDTVFGNPQAAGAAGHPGFGTNYQLSKADFPLTDVTTDPADPTNFNTRQITRDTNDRVSSAGVFTEVFGGIGQPTKDVGTRVLDPVFNGGRNNNPKVSTRRVEPRNTPSQINAVFNFANFWDGRANNVFNGVSPFGPVDDPGGIMVAGAGGALSPVTVRIANSSLASQAVGPPGSSTEMAFIDRPFPIIGRKLFGLRPLGQQLVSPSDSLLGSLSRNTGLLCPVNNLLPIFGSSCNGLKTNYADLIKAAFQDQWWNSPQKTAAGNTLMENNFSLFFGIAIQQYESLLKAGQTPFDRFMDGSNSALSSDQLKGLLVFMHRPGNLAAAGQETNPLFTGVGTGACIACHGGGALSDATFGELQPPPIGDGKTKVEETLKLVNGHLVQDDPTAFQDQGFFNIGVRPTGEDPGRGGTAPNGNPLSFVRQNMVCQATCDPPPLPDCPTATGVACPANNRVIVDGAFKAAQLRDVELTGPYFHNGGKATLKQVVDFYRHQGDFGDVNILNTEDDMQEIHFSPTERDQLVKFLLSLTDQRVKDQQGPFDHPSLSVANGHPGDANLITCSTSAPGSTVKEGCDQRLDIPAVGKAGRTILGLKLLTPFLNLDPLLETLLP